MNEAAAFIIDLDETHPEIKYIDKEGLELDFKAYKTRSLEKLSDNDRKYFSTFEAAETFLKKYLSILNNLHKLKICNSRDLPAILYKRRYIVQSLLGLKNQTYRDYKKDWKPGQLVNLHDQTNFLTVRIKKIAFCEERQSWKYDFELP